MQITIESKNFYKFCTFNKQKYIPQFGAKITYCDTNTVTYCDTNAVTYCDTNTVTYCDTNTVTYCDTM